MATEKRYSLEDIFQTLKEANILYEDKYVCVSSENKDGKEFTTAMTKAEYIAMTVAHELINPYSRLACDAFTAKKKNIEEAMKKAGFDPIAYPNYECFGLVTRT
jgi:hypothetical protein